MKLILAALILLKSVCTLACSCGPLPPFKTKEDLKTFDFIALAEVKSASIVGKAENIETAEFKITVTELFKGSPVTAVYDEFHNTSCNITLPAGEQWLLFGYVSKGHIVIGSCSYSQPYRDISGTREWSYQGAINNLNILRTIYDHSIATVAKGKIFYPNGRLEIEQSIKDNKLDGMRKIYYPSGQIYILEKFKNGERVDFRDVYSVTGQLLSHVEYQNGAIKRITNYEDSTFQIQMLLLTAKLADPTHLERNRDTVLVRKAMDSLKKTVAWGHAFLLQEFDNNKKAFKKMVYYPNGQLRHEGYSDWGNQISEFSHYSEDGKLESYEKKDLKNHSNVEYDYKPDGTKRDFTNTCNSCGVYFDECAAMSKPEKIFIE